MKKIISLILILAIAMTFCMVSNTKAVSLNLVVDTDKATVRPGQEVKLTINFADALGAYTFDIGYDNNIFNYVSVDGGTANPGADKVRVEFHDTTGGTNPRQNMSIVFKAKDDITTSNPTELTVLGEGMSNSDASVRYDDMTTPIVKNLTVEPEYKPYEINLQHTGEVVAGKEKEMVLSYSSNMGRYYEHARLVATAITPTGATATLTALDSSTQTEQEIIQSGFGNAQGYKIGGKNVLQALNVKALFTDAGNYTITLKLIDRDHSDAIIAEKEFSYTVLEKESVVPTPTPTQDGGTKPEETKPNDTKVESQTKPANKPITPKTNDNIYVPIAILMVTTLTLGAYYKNKKIER